jgi:hypothetical protein
MSTIPREINGRPTVTPSLDYAKETRYDEYPEEKGAGWLTFAAVMLGFGGLLGLIDGIVAISKSSFYVAGANYVFSDLNTWGWIVLAAGVLAIIAAFGVATRSQLARWTGITVAGLQALAQVMMIQAYPLWSLCVFAVDLLVIYALAVYGGRTQRAP